MRRTSLFTCALAGIVPLLGAGTWNSAALAASPPLGASDLVVETIAPDSGGGGVPIQLTVVVRNQGTMPAPSSVTGVRIDEESVWLTLGTPPLEAEASAEVVCWVGPLSPGAHTVLARVDLLEMVDEADETNNSRTKVIEAREAETSSGPSDRNRSLAPSLLVPANPLRSGRDTGIGFRIPAEGHVRLDVYDSGGRWIEDLVNEPLPAGEHRVRWTSSSRSRLSNGLYFIRLTSPSGTAVRKIVILD